MRILFSLGLLALAFCAHARPEQGDMPPEIHVGTNRDGDAITLETYRGKVVVLTFWASWCGYCLKELPVLEKIQRAAGTQQLAVIAINYMEAPRVVRRLGRRMPELQLTLAHDRDGEVGAAYGVKGLPHMVMIERSGRIAFTHTGYSEAMLDVLIEEMNELLADPVPAG